MAERIICRVLTGPTASGKSALGLRLAAERGWDILCMDSMQVYRRMNIGTAKPTPEEQRMVPHHLLDLCEPAEPFSVAAYRETAEALVRRLHRDGREVLFVGGTGLYLQAMMYAMEMGAVPADETLREELKELAGRPGGREALHRMLEELDPVTAARLPLNDLRRTIRAIEVSRTTGVPFSEQAVKRGNSPFEWRVVATAMDRSQLYDRINRRVDRMMRAGLREEVASLLREGVPEDAQSMQGLGYKEMISCLRGERTGEDTAEAIRTGTRHYAKRQMTFLRRIGEVQYVNVTDADAFEQIRKKLETPADAQENT